MAKHLIITGRVQGVGFREAMRREAGRLGVTGWVRNRSEGSVEAMLDGPPEVVEAIIAWARRGPPSAKVSGVRISEAEGSFSAFEYLRTV